MILSSSDTIEVVLGEAKTTNDCPYTVGYFDSGATPAGGPLLGNTNGTTAVTPVTAPVSGYTRQVFEFTLFNADTVSHAVTVQYNNGSTTYKIIKGTLLAGETLAYSAHTGWRVLDANGNLKMAPVLASVVGITDGVDAAAGYVGEIKRSTVLAASASALTTNTPLAITTLSLTPGDWDICGIVQFTDNASGSVTYMAAGINTSNVFPTSGVMDANLQGTQSSTPLVNNDFDLPLGPTQKNITTTTTMYLVGQAGFGSGGIKVFGEIRARRMR